MVATVRAPLVDLGTVGRATFTAEPAQIWRVLRVLVGGAVEAVVVFREACIGSRSCLVRVRIAGVGVVNGVPRSVRCELLGRKSSNISVRPVLCCGSAANAKTVATASACYRDGDVVRSVTTLAAEDRRCHRSGVSLGICST